MVTPTMLWIVLGTLVGVNILFLIIILWQHWVIRDLMKDSDAFYKVIKKAGNLQ